MINMYLFFETETTGLPINWEAPINDLDNWPRLVQIAWLLFDKQQNLLDEKNYIIRPDGFSIPDKPAEIHKISTDLAFVAGNDLSRILKEFSSVIERAETIISHNLNFDEKIVGAEFLRKRIYNSLALKRKICTMEATKDFCAIPGHNGYKLPGLSELYYKLFGTQPGVPLSAAEGTKATAECFWELKSRGFF